MDGALALLLASGALVLWTYAGYPMALWLVTRWAARPIQRGPVAADVALVIVVRNEAKVIADKLASCLAQTWPADRLRIVVVSDGSTDDTQAIVEGFRDPRIEWRGFADHRGKAARVCQIAAERSESILVLTDARQRLHPEAVGRLLEPFADPTVGAVGGALHLESDPAARSGPQLGAYWRYESAVRRLEARLDSMVGVSGALYALRRSAFQPIPDSTVLDDVLIPMQVAAQGWRVVYAPEAIAWDRIHPDPAIERRRKVRTLAGNFALLAEQPWLLNPQRNRLWWQFMSHKVARLAVPPALVLALAATAALVPARPVFGLLLAAQLILYAAALHPRWAEQAARAKPMRLALTFVQMNAYVWLGFREWRSNRRLHAWRP